jgi:hypothetical protein
MNILLRNFVSTYWKLGVIHPALYHVKEDNIIISSVEPPDNYITAEQGIPDTIWALNVLNCFKNHLSE